MHQNKKKRHGLLVNIILVAVVAILINLKITVWRGNTTPYSSTFEKDPAGLYTHELPTDSALWEHLKYMNSLGHRFTGSHAQKQFIRYIDTELTNDGIQTFKDTYRFDRWEAKTWGLSTRIDGEDQPISTTFYYPYSGETSQEGITAELVYIGNNNSLLKKAQGKIALFEVEQVNFPYTMLFRKRSRLPEETNFPFMMNNSVVSSILSNPDLELAVEQGVKGIVCVWKGISKENARAQYLPFTTPYAGIPVLWVSEDELPLLKEIANNRQEVTLKLEGEKVDNMTSSTLYAVVPGKNEQETIIINTHTDGPNAVEENGAIALIELAKYYHALPIEKRNRTLVFVFATGHFQLPQFGVDERQATSVWLADHPELWDGIDGNKKAVAGVSIEHLGAMEWEDTDNGYEPTGNIDRELVYTSNKTLDAIYMKALEDRTLVRTITLRPHNGFYFGEGEPLFSVGIPTISLVATPSYLCKVSSNGGIEKLNRKLIYEQTDTFRKIINTLDSIPTQEIGETQRMSYGIW